MSRSRVVYAIVGATAVLLVAGAVLVLANRDRVPPEAEDKATQLISSYQAAGFATPFTADEVAHTLGTDGGTVCQSAATDQGLAALGAQLAAGGNVGSQPVTIDRQRVQGLVLIVKTYCPDKLDEVEALVDNMDFTPTPAPPSTG